MDPFTSHFNIQGGSHQTNLFEDLHLSWSHSSCLVLLDLCLWFT